MSIQLPTPRLPKPLDLPVIHLKEPSALVPSYKPMVIPPADLERPEETEASEEEKEQKTEQSWNSISNSSIRIDIIKKLNTQRVLELKVSFLRYYP